MTVLTPRHSRAARGWLDWKQDRLAREAGVSLSVVRTFETEKHAITPRTTTMLMGAFARAGIVLFDSGVSQMQKPD